MYKLNKIETNVILIEIIIQRYNFFRAHSLTIYVFAVAKLHQNSDGKSKLVGIFEVFFFSKKSDVLFFIVHCCG